MIEYDRQVIGGIAAIYISFDGAAVGVLQGKGVVAGLKANGHCTAKKPVVAELHGGQTDNNSFLFKGGYESVLNPLYKNGTFKKGPQQFTPGWDNQKAGTIFEQMLVKTKNNIQGVAAANDGLANAVVVALKAHKLKPIALSGQDATEQGVQNIISGWQTMTVWKDTRKLQRSRLPAAIALLNGQTPRTTGTVKNGSKNAARLHHRARLDHEGELQAALQRLLEEARRSASASTRSTALGSDVGWGPSRRASPHLPFHP